MADFPLGWHNGVHGGDETRLPPGFVREMDNWVFLPDDPDCPYPALPCTEAGDLPGAATSSNTKGVRFISYDGGTDKFVLLANSRLYEATAGTTVSSWSQVEDQQGTSTAFSRTGSFLKTVADGTNRWITFTGAQERALIRDVDGNWRMLGLLAPSKLSLTALTSAAPRANVYPTSPTDLYGGDDTGFGPATVVGLLNAGNSMDANLQTSASKRLDAAGQIWGARFSFAAATTTSSQSLVIVYSASSQPIYRAPSGAYRDPRRDFDEDVQAGTGSIKVEYSTTGSGGTYTTVGLSSQAPPTMLVVPLSDGVAYSSVVVRVSGKFISGDTSVTHQVWEVYIVSNTATASTAIDVGTYWYCQTEVYSLTLSDGSSFLIESSPSEPESITTTSSTLGVQITIPTAANGMTHGVKHDPANGKLLYRKLYRSTKSGSPPDLGYLFDIPIGATTTSDDFTVVSATSLGYPLNYVYTGTATVPAAGTPPAIWDAVYYQGALAVIPAGDRSRLQWSIAGQTEYFPLPTQDLKPQPSDRNDELVGVTAVGEYILLFLRTRVLRLRDLSFVSRANYDPGRLRLETLSPNEGLAGSPISHCLFQSQKGHSVAAWVSDSGIWMSDGSLPSEGGLGISKLTANVDWNRIVDTSALSSCSLTYDPITQIIFFDYTDRRASARRSMLLHVAPHHWVPSGQDQAVPKITFCTRIVDARTIGEYGGQILHWSLSKENLILQNERTGTGNLGEEIASILETGWVYPKPPGGDFHIYTAKLYHGPWGSSEGLNMDFRTRRDDTGVVVTTRKPGIPLGGSRVSSVFLGSVGAGQSLKVSLHRSGFSAPPGVSPKRSLGPLVMDLETFQPLMGE